MPESESGSRHRSSQPTGRRERNADTSLNFEFSPQWDGNRFKGFHNEELGLLHNLIPRNHEHPYNFGKKYEGEHDLEYYHQDPKIHGPWIVRLFQGSRRLWRPEKGHPGKGTWLHDHIDDNMQSSRSQSEASSGRSSPEQGSGEDSMGHNSDEPHKRERSAGKAPKSSTRVVDKALAKMHLSYPTYGTDGGQPGSSKDSAAASQQRSFDERAAVARKIQEQKQRGQAPVDESRGDQRSPRKKLEELDDVEKFVDTIRRKLRRGDRYAGTPPIEALEDVALKPGKRVVDEKGRAKKEADRVVPVPWSAIKEAMKRLLNKDELGAAKEMIQDCDTEFEDRHGESAIDGKK
ncbi:MAG: hypothetical protein Q9159_002883 [Coniocarpon cinnabarinum]